MTYRTYEFTAFTEEDLGGSIGCGSTFTMAAAASTCISVGDNDPFLSGDSYRDEQANDYYGQQASIEGADGTELGNNGQIYAESYYWVSDQDGNWYVMIEVEQEGSDDDYFTFFNGGGYTTPPAGAELTVGNACNVTGNWLDYKCLDAGEKEATGSISGTVFCDDDCDGINGTETVIPGCDYVIEAESMNSSGFHVVQGAQASGGALAKLYCAGGRGDLSTNFNGKTGVYDVKIRIQDEYDGQSTVYFKVGGELVKAIRLNQDNNGQGSNNGGFSTFVIEDVAIDAGDQIMLWAAGNGNEFVRVDNIELIGQDTTVITEEPTKSGVTVKLLDLDGTVVATTQTDQNGAYSFDDIPVGDYKIMGVAPDGTEFTIKDAGNNDNIDSDVDANGMSDVVTVTANTNSDIDIGLKAEKLGALEGRLFMDNNDNAIEDAADMGISGQTVLLLNSDGVVVGSTQTGANGEYSFSDLAPGQYSVRFPTSVDGKVLVNANVGGDDTVDSDADQTTGETQQVTVVAGETTSDVDAGVADPGTASLAGRVFMDNNDNDIDDAGDMGIQGVTVTLSNGQTTVTDSNGNYEFIDLDAGTYTVTFPTDVDGKPLVGQNVGSDNTIDSDANQMTGTTGPIDLGIGERSENNDAGVADPGTASLAGRFFMDLDKNDLETTGDTSVSMAQVQLLLGGVVIATQITDANGAYLFENLSAGDYQVRFVNSSDKVFVTPEVGDDFTVDSDAIDNGDGTATTRPVTVNIGDAITDIDAGIVDPGTASLGDKVFIDANGNGQQDAGEVGVEGVDVTLLDENGMIVGSTFTNGNGNYIFNDLDAGTYSVEFGDVDGFDFTTANTGNDATDSDADQATGRTGTYTLAIGDENLTVDAGLVAENSTPTPMDDAGTVCADETIKINVLENDSDPDQDNLTITQVDGKDIVEGGTITTDTGVDVMLMDGQLVFDGEDAYADLDINEQATDTISYTVSDGTDTASANVAVTFKGDANSLESLLESLPEDGTYQIVTGIQSDPQSDRGFALKIDGTGDARLDGMVFENAYCLSVFDPADGTGSFADAPLLNGEIFGTGEALVDPAINADVFDSVQIGVNGQTAEENMDLIQWIVAQNYEDQAQYSGYEVQFAIWALTDDVDPDFFFNNNTFAGEAADVREIVQNAIDSGEGFTPDLSQTASFIVDPNPETGDNSQPFIVAFNPEDYDCIC